MCDSEGWSNKYHFGALSFLAMFQLDIYYSIYD